MRALTLRLYEDLLPDGCPPVYLPATPRALYVVDGGLMVEGPDDGQWLTTGTARVSQDSTTLIAERSEARIWRWELTAASTPADHALLSAPSTSTTLKLEAEIELDPRFDWLMRCDEVGFPPGGVALTHVHQGPGIRICASGEISIETQGKRHTHAPGEAWFELGPAPVLAPTTERTSTHFVRCFLLPRAVRSRSSIRYVRPEDADAPKVQTYRVFAERDIDLPA
ncbi:conserved hypothetical protein [Luteimonas sp. 9C]|uniref:hypothetical protein n=1 Tax=Luteimonas sp. 9C TaxID=2653148 RepID=UPI0012F25B75|nr:hypothetical protein [Luteimonas sp. 9C]VXB14666.1 conserved hypothetical protein [Luteimonas sp. 9C]